MSIRQAAGEIPVADTHLAIELGTPAARRFELPLEDGGIRRGSRSRRRIGALRILLARLVAELGGQPALLGGGVGARFAGEQPARGVRDEIAIERSQPRLIAQPLFDLGKERGVAAHAVATDNGAREYVAEGIAPGGTNANW